MGVGTPCPMPEGKREAIQTQIMMMKALGLSIYEIAPKMQNIWPGCEANHVRGVIAGMASKAKGGRSGSGNGMKRRMMRAEPWRPGEPRK